MTRSAGSVWSIIPLVVTTLAGCVAARGGPDRAPSRSPPSGSEEAAPNTSEVDHAASSAPRQEPRIAIERIADAIKKHIAAESASHGGYFLLPFEEATLRLKLVRVHMEYLSDLGGGVQFACVDLADTRGDVFDVDFFTTGSADAMTVTETTVHKLNGKPFYAWEQRDDGTWRRIAVEAASERELGVLTGQDEFEFRYHALLPAIVDSGRVWLPYPESDVWQRVEVASIEVPGRRRIIRDREHDNRILLLELGPLDGEKSLDIVYRVQRREKKADAQSTIDAAAYLKPSRLVPANARFESIAREVLADKDQDLVRARALYDHVIDSMRYMKFGDFGRGDALYACDVGTGNCTEYHSYFMALSQSAAIPSRFSIGVAIPSERDDGGIDGYHCWAEFYAEGKWWPVDISEADKYSRLATYYFGHHPANRFELSRGRDLEVDPMPISGPINFLAYPVLEIDGKPANAQVEFSFTRNASMKPASREDR